MNNSIYRFPLPTNEPIYSYMEGSKERIALFSELERLKNQQHDVPCIIGGKEYFTGNTTNILMPHDHKNPLGKYHNVGEKELDLAVEAAMKAHREWSDTPFTVRASILNKAAELITGKYRALLSAATMLGQSKNIFQSEIDAVCETVDFLRFNAHFASKIYEFQPASSANMMNSMEYRALEGFVFTVSPFNFTAIASNLNMSAVLMGNVTIWKPASTAILSNYYLMKIFQEAGVPDGVINFIPGKGSMIGRRIMKDSNLAGVHFTGSNNTFNTLWKQVGENLTSYKSYPRLVGETGGKDFIFVHPSADALEVAVNALRGSFEYQGQKCSAASRMYMPASLWPKVKDTMVSLLSEIKMGDVMDPANFVNAVIDQPAYDTIMDYIRYAEASSDAKIVCGGKGDNSVGYFIQPTIIETTNPKFKTMEEEIFGPVLTVWVYEDAKLEEAIHLCDTTSPYGLTGAIFGRDRMALEKMTQQLRYAAGNFYINDKPTGAVVGQQPFGGSRGSGTNDKAGGELNLIRWVSARTIKETFNPPIDYRYAYML